MNFRKITMAVMSGVLALSSVSSYNAAAEYTGEGDPGNAVYKNTITIDTVTLTEEQAKEYAANGTEIEIGVNIGSEGAGVCVNSTGLDYYIDNRLGIASTSMGSYIWTADTLYDNYNCMGMDNRTGITITDENGSELNGIFVATFMIGQIDEEGVFYKFKVKLPEDVSAGDKFSINTEYRSDETFADRFIYGTGASATELGDEAWTFTYGITNGGIIITGDEGEVKYGDANNDGDVNVSDATLIMQSLANGDEYALSDEGADNADVDNRGDGVTAMDALVIQQYLNGSVSTLPVE